MRAPGNSAPGGSTSPAVWPIGGNPLIGWAILAWRIPGAMPPCGKWFARVTLRYTPLLREDMATPHCTIMSCLPWQAVPMNSSLRTFTVSRLGKRQQQEPGDGTRSAPGFPFLTALSRCPSCSLRSLHELCLVSMPESAGIRSISG